MLNVLVLDVHALTLTKVRTVVVLDPGKVDPDVSVAVIGPDHGRSALREDKQDVAEALHASYGSSGFTPSRGTAVT